MDKPVVVQIKGTNGSGKTTIARQLIALSKEKWYMTEPTKTGKQRVLATVLYDLQWVVLGNYPEDSKMGGCDGLKTIDIMKGIITRALEEYPGYWILFEGMMISTLKDTFYLWLKELDVEPVFVFLITNTQSCLDRINSRGTNSIKNPQNIDDKNRRIAMHADYYDPKMVAKLYVDRIDREAMLSRFLDAIGDERTLAHLLEPESLPEKYEEYDGKDEQHGRL